MDSIVERKQSLGDFATMPANGGMITVRERPALQYGQKSLVQNLRCWHPGFETRKGYTKNNSTAYNASADSPLNIYQFVKGELTEKHLFVQFGDTKLLEATNMPPAAGTTFGTVVHDGAAGQIPAAFADIDDYMVYSNGADQHQVYAGKTQDIEGFVVVKDSEAHDLLPEIGEDYTTEVTDGESSTVAVLDSLGNYVDDFDSFYIMTKTPIDKLNLTMAAVNTTKSKLFIDYWTGSWKNVTITDGTSVSDVALAQTGTVALGTTAPNRTDEIPRYMFNQSGYWYKIYVNPFAESSNIFDLTAFTEVDGNGVLDVTASKATATDAEEGDNYYLYSDEGAGEIGDYDYMFSFTVTEGEDQSGIFLFSVTNTLGTGDDIDNSGAGQSIMVEVDGSILIAQLDAAVGGNGLTTSSEGWDTDMNGDIVYIRVKREGADYTVWAYRDANMTDLIDSRTFGDGDETTYRYLYAIAASWLDGKDMSGYTQNLASVTVSSLDAEVEISHVTYDCESFTPMVNVWNSIPIDLIEAQLNDDSEGQYDVYAAAAITISEMTSSDSLYLSSTDQLEAIYFEFGSTPNTTGTPTITIQYWDGAAWANVTEVDGTGNFTETGWISFGRQTGEFKRQFRSTKYYAYWYKITVSTTLSDNVVLSVLGMPYYDIEKLGSVGRFSLTWKNRALYTFNKFPRDLYVSEAGEFLKLNGSDFAILQPGDGRSNATVAGVRFHNEIMVFQEEKGEEGGCVTVFEGYSPSTFGKLVLSTKVGTLNAKSVAVVDGSKTSQTNKERSAQTMVFFLSHYGVFMSDGQIVTGISDDIQNYFDQRFAECLRTGYESEMWLSYDSTENVIKIGIVSGSSATTCNKFFVYDLTDGQWYEDVYATSLSVAKEIESGSGQFFTRFISAGSTTGFVYLMNDGTTDDGTTIVSKLTWEFNNGAYFISIDEFLTRMKVSAAQVYTLTAEENDVQVFSESGSLTAYAPSETMIRNRHLTDFDQRSWCSITLQASVPIYLYDCGIDASSTVNK